MSCFYITSSQNFMYTIDHKLSKLEQMSLSHPIEICVKIKCYILFKHLWLGILSIINHVDVKQFMNMNRLRNSKEKIWFSFHVYFWLNLLKCSYHLLSRAAKAGNKDNVKQSIKIMITKQLTNGYSVNIYFFNWTQN